MQIRGNPVWLMLLKVGNRSVARCYGQNFGADGARAFDIAFGVADDQDLGWVQLGPAGLGPGQGVAGDVVAVGVFATEDAHFEFLPNTVVLQLQFRTAGVVAGEQANDGCVGPASQVGDQFSCAGQGIVFIGGQKVREAAQVSFKEAVDVLLGALDLVLLEYFLHQPAVGTASKGQGLSGLRQAKYFIKGRGKGPYARAMGADEGAVDIK